MILVSPYFSSCLKILCSTKYHGRQGALGCRTDIEWPEQEKDGRPPQHRVRAKSFTASHQCSYFSRRDNNVLSPRFSQDSTEEDSCLKETMDNFEIMEKCKRVGRRRSSLLKELLCSNKHWTSLTRPVHWQENEYTQDPRILTLLVLNSSGRWSRQCVQCRKMSVPRASLGFVLAPFELRLWTDENHFSREPELFHFTISETGFFTLLNSPVFPTWKHFVQISSNVCCVRQWHLSEFFYSLPSQYNGKIQCLQTNTILLHLEKLHWFYIFSCSGKR